MEKLLKIQNVSSSIKITSWLLLFNTKMASQRNQLLIEDKMSQARLLKFKTYPSNFLFQELCRLEANFSLQIDLPIFPKELHEVSSELQQGLQKVSAFAVSKLLMESLTNTKPFIILKNLSSTPLKIRDIIVQAKSKALGNNNQMKDFLTSKHHMGLTKSKQ